jgi:threonine/homoserine/homoserine lactone efflux protein
MAAFGLTFVASLLIDQQDWIRLLGGLFLFYLGVRTLLSEVAQQPVQASRGLLGGYLSTFALTLTNPLTILSFAAVFAGLGVGSSEDNSTMAALATVLGVFAGSALWWLALSTGVNLLRTRFSPQGLRWVNRISGLVLIGFAILALVSLAV